MDDEILLALNQDKVIDITTRGRKTGLDRRIEIWFHTIDGQVIITGSTGRRWGRRDWLANLLAHPSFYLPSEAERAGRPLGAGDAGNGQSQAPQAFHQA